MWLTTPHLIIIVLSEATAQPGQSSTIVPPVRVGLYSWDMSYWREGDPLLLNFMDSELGRAFSSGSLYVNIADYTSPDMIPDQDKLVAFAKNYRSRMRDRDCTLFFTYGDVTSRDGQAMITFTHTFFRWLLTIPESEALLMGKIGLSFDVEHMHPDYVREVLLLARDLRRRTAFGDSNLVIQITIEGDRNILGTDYAMRYADSVLVMMYSNFMKSADFPADKNLISRLVWLLTTQCEKCLDDTYAVTEYHAKITMMIEASCNMGRSCSWASFCAHDRPDEGAEYLAQTLAVAHLELLSTGLVTPAQYSRLFNLEETFVVHNFEWYICYAPFQAHFDHQNCKTYHQLARECRAN
jgi:hypothetical protein